MKIFRQLIQFTLMAIAFAISSTLASCSSNVNPEDYDAVLKEVNRKPGFREKEEEKQKRNVDLILSGLESAKSKNDYDLVKKYYTLYTTQDYVHSWWRETPARNVIDYYMDENQLSYAKEILSMERGNAFDIGRYKEIRNKIEKAEVTHLISLKSEEAANRVISILERPTETLSIGEDWFFSTLSEKNKALANFNNKLDEYLRIALSQNNDVAAKKILTQYVEIANIKTYAKKDPYDRQWAKVIGLSDKPKKDAMKIYKEHKELWKSLEN